MNIELEKYKLVEWLVRQNNEEVIAKLKAFKTSVSQDSEIDYEVSNTEKLFIQAGLKDISEGNIFSNEEVVREINDKYGL